MKIPQFPSVQFLPKEVGPTRLLRITPVHDLPMTLAIHAACLGHLR
jgi:hypothetical protein